MSSRPLAALASVIIAVGGLVVLLPDCASACSCGGGGSKEEIVEWALSHPGAVFSGEVVEVDKGSQISNVTLRVDEVWKGPQRETIQVSTPSYGAACGYPFKEGQEYLVYAYEKEEPFKVDLCSQTKPLSKASGDLALLDNSSERPTGGEVLSDTSGGASVRAMVGVAGLALAASLLLMMRLVRTG